MKEGALEVGHSLPPGEAGWSLCWCVCLFRRLFPKKSGASGTHTTKKEQIPLFLGPKRVSLAVCDLFNLAPLSPLLFASTASGCGSRTRPSAFSHIPGRLMETGKCRAPHSDPTSGRLRAFRTGSLSSTLLPHLVYVCGPWPGLWKPKLFPKPVQVELFHQTRLAILFAIGFRPSSVIFCHT